MATAARNRSKGNSNDNIDDADFDTREIVRAKLNQANFVTDLDAFNTFLDHMEPAAAEIGKSHESGFRIVAQAARILNEGVDDNSSSFWSDSDDEFASSSGRRASPRRGIRKDHSGDLERLFQIEPEVTIDQLVSPAASHDLKKINGSGSPRDSSSKQRSGSLGRKQARRRDELSSMSEHARRRLAGASGNRAGDSLSKSEHGKLRTKSTAEKLTTKGIDLRRSDDLSKQSDHGRGRRRYQASQSAVDASTKSSQSPAPSDHSASRTRGADKPRHRRDELSSGSEHVRPRLRRDDLYSKRQSSSGARKELGTRRVSSDLNFQAGVIAAHRRQQPSDVYGAVSHRTSRSRGMASEHSHVHSTEISPSTVLPGLSRTSGHRNSSSELVQQPSRMRRSQTSTGNLSRRTGSRNGMNNMLLAGLYAPVGEASSFSRPATLIGTDDARNALRTHGGKSNIDDLVLNMKRTAKTNMLHKMHGNATWNLSVDT